MRIACIERSRIGPPRVNAALERAAALGYSLLSGAGLLRLDLRTAKPRIALAARVERHIRVRTEWKWRGK